MSEHEQLKNLAKAVMTQWEKDGLPEDFEPEAKDMFDFFLGIDDAKSTSEYGTNLLNNPSRRDD